jgi:mRNA-degrading endonuclease toxin of MazEF toxin-antitoxin module
VQGREQAGHRPVLVLSINAINQLPLVLTGVVGTRGENVRRDYPTKSAFPVLLPGAFPVRPCTALRTRCGTVSAYKAVKPKVTRPVSLLDLLMLHAPKIGYDMALQMHGVSAHPELHGVVRAYTPLARE